MGMTEEQITSAVEWYHCERTQRRLRMAGNILMDNLFNRCQHSKAEIQAARKLLDQHERVRQTLGLPNV